MQQRTSPVQVTAFMATRSMMPWKLSSEPMGSVTTAGLAPSMLSIMLTVLHAKALVPQSCCPLQGVHNLALQSPLLCGVCCPHTSHITSRSTPGVST